jgi:hypothetical protein
MNGMTTLDASCKGLEEERNDSYREFSSRHGYQSVIWKVGMDFEDRKAKYD